MSKDNGSVNGSINNDGLYGILKECFSGIAKVDIDEKNMIAMSLKSKYVKRRPQNVLSSEFDKLIDDVFENYEERLFTDKIDNHYTYPGYNNNNSMNKNLSDKVDKSYDHQDPNSKIIIFDTQKDVLMHNHRYIIVKTLLGKNIALPDITINTQEYQRKDDGSITYSKKLNSSQIQKYLAFVIGAVNIFGGYDSSKIKKNAEIEIPKNGNGVLIHETSKIHK